MEGVRGTVFEKRTAVFCRSLVFRGAASRGRSARDAPLPARRTRKDSSYDSDGSLPAPPRYGARLGTIVGLTPQKGECYGAAGWQYGAAGAMTGVGKGLSLPSQPARPHEIYSWRCFAIRTTGRLRFSRYENSKPCAQGAPTIKREKTMGAGTC